MALNLCRPPPAAVIPPPSPPGCANATKDLSLGVSAGGTSGQGLREFPIGRY